ncbi:MAG: multidrug ABC transporter [Candidatus Sumerlaeota bacterium]|nr:multidrug ABC transporter [Candidatus Sumerlaeota bacterium]
MLKHYTAAFLGVFLTAISQLLFKLGVNQTRQRSALLVYLNPLCVVACAMLFAVTLLNLYAYKQLPLKVSVVILPFTYILIGVFSLVFLKEKATRGQLTGALIIIIGIVIYNLNLG